MATFSSTILEAHGAIHRHMSQVSVARKPLPHAAVLGGTTGCHTVASVRICHAIS